MNIKIKLTKKQLLHLAIFVAVIGIAALIDSYLDKNPVQIDEVGTASNSQHNESNTVYLHSQLNVPGAKVELQKPAVKKILPKIHDRFIQKYHHARNYQVLKTEVEPKTSPLILGYHYLAFKNYYFTDPDDDHPLAL